MFDLFFSCSNFPNLCSDRTLELSGSFRARRQLQALSHSLCQILSTSIKPFMNQFRLNNYAGIIWHIIMNKKHTHPRKFQFIYRFHLLKTAHKQHFHILFFILNSTMCLVYNHHQHGLYKTKLFLVNLQIHFHFYFYFFVSIVYA